MKGEEKMSDKNKWEWPDKVRSLAGAWVDFPSAEELRQETGPDVKREEFPNKLANGSLDN